ncbi:N-acetyl-beta-glucosaminyl-glycoprotein like [Actinidia chinensis var. chinensis]|uniref:N-acetyl-beta-glucosaminyl-glycoprotein like n=1 Tax=Actinidia chinensis var. chinensis TaxID=1590841 RepID=A0A2R6QR39_ACTCC|nr:N-acetyl-beta-glucosaminyl-glycoprotein like [Actinidia chinensis var. chinensis]
MVSSNSPSFLLCLLVLISLSPHLSLGHRTSGERFRGGGRRVLTSFKETPSGGNVTFECSPSGPCVSCLYSEKNDEKYRCSETGYRIPLKCVESVAGSNQANDKKSQKSRSALENTSAEAKLHVMLHNAEEISSSIKHRSLLADSSKSTSWSQAYITYRSCIPAVNEEKLSVLGFEGVILGLLLLSSSVIYFKRKRNSAVSGVGAVRIPTNSRF